MRWRRRRPTPFSATAWKSTTRIGPANFLAEFQKRRGYDLTPYLPALAGDIGPVTGAIRHDWGQTLSELCEDQYLQPLTAWAKAHGTKFRSQTYGIPPVTLSSQRLVDLPEGEGTQWRRFSTTRWATSANHLYGQPGDFERDLDVAAFAGIPRHAAGYEGGGRPALFAGRESIGGARLAVHSAFGARAGLAFLRGGGVQSAQSVVDRDAGHHDLPAAHQLAFAAGNAGHRRSGLPADARRVRGLHAWGAIR